MSQEKTTPKLPNDPPETVIENDPNDAAQIVESQATPAPADKSDDDAGPPPKFTDDARNAINKNADLARRKVGEYKPQVGDKPAFQGHEDPMAVTQAEQVITQAEQSQTTTEAEDLDDAALDRYVTKVVNGQKQRVKVRDLVANAQMYDASESRLNQAKDLVGQLQRMQDELRTPRSSPEAEPTEATDPNQTRATRREEMKRIAEKLQLGDVEEAAEALESVIDASAGKSTQPQIDASQVRLLIQDTQTESELIKFAEEVGSDFVNSEALQAEMRKAAQNEMRQDLRTIGIPDDVIGRIRTQADLRAVHREARRQGYKVRTDETIFKLAHTTAHDEIRKAFGVPPRQQPTTPASPSANPAPLQARVELKRNTAQPPARRQTPTAPVSPPPNIDAKRSEALVAMRKARGQPV